LSSMFDSKLAALGDSMIIQQLLHLLKPSMLLSGWIRGKYQQIIL
jgi:hypothetical protein